MGRRVSRRKDDKRAWYKDWRRNKAGKRWNVRKRIGKDECECSQIVLSQGKGKRRREEERSRWRWRAKHKTTLVFENESNLCRTEIGKRSNRKKSGVGEEDEQSANEPVEISQSADELRIRANSVEKKNVREQKSAEEWQQFGRKMSRHKIRSGGRGSEGRKEERNKGRKEEMKSGSGEWNRQEAKGKEEEDEEEWNERTVATTTNETKATVENERVKERLDSIKESRKHEKREWLERRRKRTRRKVVDDATLN